MRLLTSGGPNPRIVRMFAAERGIDLRMEAVDISNGDNRKSPYTDVNRYGQTPSLVLDNGDVVTEVVAICEYLDETQPGTRLIGATAEERAQTRRWLRWADLNICEPLGNAYRYGMGLDMYGNRMRCLPDAVDGLTAITQDNIAFLDFQLAERTYVAGDKFTLADIHLFCFLDFGNKLNLPLDPKHVQVRRWLDGISARPSTAA